MAPPVIHIDVPWLLQRHEEVLPDQPTVNDFSALVAAVARHRVDPPRLGIDSDPAWRAAALLHTLALLKPLPSANARFACASAWRTCSSAASASTRPTAPSSTSHVT